MCADRYTTKVREEGGSVRHTINERLNIPYIVNFLDGAFSGIIKDARRVKGMYELKPWGFEYRSLPAYVSLLVVEQALTALADESRRWVW